MSTPDPRAELRAKIRREVRERWGEGNKVPPTVVFDAAAKVAGDEIERLQADNERLRKDLEDAYKTIRAFVPDHRRSGVQQSPGDPE